MPKIISVHSFRGGTGKSNLVANMTTLLAMRGHQVGGESGGRNHQQRNPR